MRPEEMGSLPLQVEKLFYGLQDRIMSDVVRRIKKTGEITSTADYQLNRIKILGNSTEFIEDELKRLLNATYPEIFALYDKVIDWEYVRNKSLYEQVNGQFTPSEENDWLQELSSAIVSQTKGEIKNITQSLGFSLDYGNGKKVFTPLSEYYQKYLDRACLDIASGAFDYNTALRRVVREMTSSGIRSVDYASGYSNRAPVAAIRAVMTGVHNLSNKINEQLAKELETDDFEVTAHYGARPTHAVWQGRVYSRRELESICGLGSVTGLCGANCNHSYLPFIKGISTRTYTDEMLEDIREDDARIRKYRGKEYDGYTCRQRQREMETTMRAQRERIKYLKEGGGHDAVLAAQAKYLQTLHEYKGFSKIMGLQPQMERVYMDGLGRMAGGRIPTKAVVKSGGSDIIKHIKIPQIPASTVSKKVEAGEYSTKLSKQQYEKHVFGTKKYMEYRQTREAKGGNPQSILTISADEVQDIINRKSGTGIVRVDRNGNARNVEDIICDKVIGQYYAKGSFHDTKKASIHYSKNNAHIVPIRGDNYD